MVEFEKRRLTTETTSAGEHAAAAVAVPDFASERRRNVTHTGPHNKESKQFGDRLPLDLRDTLHFAIELIV